MATAFCTKCGWQHDGSARFCQQCGSPLSPTTPAVATAPAATSVAAPAAVGGPLLGPDDHHWVSEEQDLWLGKSMDMVTGGSWSPNHYRLTTRSLFFAHGRMGSVEKSVPLWAVREVTVERSLVDKARHVGDILVDVAHVDWTEGTQEVRLENIENPEQVRDLILQRAREESFNYERRNQTMFYQGRPPIPPR